MSREPDLPDRSQLGEWLSGAGPDSDIAVCTRVRLARNVQGYNFSPRMSEAEAEELTAYLEQQVTDLLDGESLRIIGLRGLDELERLMLMERHLISRDHAQARKARSVGINERESVSVMMNEEDHLRAQVFLSGFQVRECYAIAENLDLSLMSRLPVVFSEEFGFLTTCPTNTGTGMRVSVMLHLPGLVWAEEIEKATDTAQKIHLAVRGLYGEGSRALGDFYQVSNQVTLGRSESQILEDVDTAVRRLVQWEREVRDALRKGRSKRRTEDRVHRAMGTLDHAHILSSEETLTCLSAVRFGVQQEMLDGLDLDAVNQALLWSQPAHLQRFAQQTLGPEERDERRAQLVRRLLCGRN